MKFIRYRSITNHYQTKFINGFLEQYPELLTAKYILVEKAHGSSLQVFFSPNEPWVAGKRNSFLKENEKFYAVWNVLEQHEDTFQTIQGYVDITGETIRLFGELYGPGVQKGVDYGKTKKLGFFDAMENDEMLSPQDFYSFADEHGFIDDTLPTVAIVDGLQSALDYDIEFNSLLNPIENNPCEGVVIKPYNRTYYDRKNRWFCLKKKNEKFMEKVKSPKPPRIEDPVITSLNLAFRGYINDNRLQSVFSKEGEIEEPSQIGQYIKWVLEDAKIDFLSEHEEEMAALDKKAQRRVWNVGGLIANALKGYL